MEERITVLDFGIVERRFYEDGKLVDIRKEYPSQPINPGFGHSTRGWVVKSPGRIIDSGN